MKQTSITAFFKRPDRSTIFRQSCLPEFFGQKAIERRRVKRARVERGEQFLRESNKKRSRKHYRAMRSAIVRNYTSHHPYDVSLGSLSGVFYFRKDDFYHYHAVDPCSGLVIGQVVLDDEYWLIQLEVNERYRRRGIGTQLMRLANRETEGRVQVSLGQLENSRYRLTDAGMCLIKACIRKGILLSEQTPDCSIPSPAYSAGGMGGYC